MVRSRGGPLGAAEAAAMAVSDIAEGVIGEVGASRRRRRLRWAAQAWRGEACWDGAVLQMVGSDTPSLAGRTGRSDAAIEGRPAARGGGCCDGGIGHRRGD